MGAEKNPLIWLVAAIGRRGKIGGAITGVIALTLTVMVLVRGFDAYQPAALVRTFGFLAVLWVFTVVLFFGANVWKRDERFKPMKIPDLLAALPFTKRPFFVCLDCKVILPFEVAV